VTRLKWKFSLVRLEIVVTLRKIGAQFAPSVLEARISFWTHQMELLGDMGPVESRFGPFGDSVSVSAR
jgi:hypothetical protein